MKGTDKQRDRHGGTERRTAITFLSVCKTTLYFAWFQASAAKRLRTALFWAITQRVVVSPYRRFGTTYRSHHQGSRVLDSLNLQDGTERLSQNVGNELPLPAAKQSRRVQFSHCTCSQGCPHTSLSEHWRKTMHNLTIRTTVFTGDPLSSSKEEQPSSFPVLIISAVLQILCSGLELNSSKYSPKCMYRPISILKTNLRCVLKMH